MGSLSKKRGKESKLSKGSLQCQGKTNVRSPFLAWATGNARREPHEKEEAFQNLRTATGELSHIRSIENSLQKRPNGPKTDGRERGCIDYETSN